MEQKAYRVSFATPAFLGNATQQGQWRTPPFKALIRQWWRVAVAKDCNYDVNELRRREAELFGSAAGEGECGRSKVRLRLDAWSPGTLTQWQTKGFSRVDNQVNADVYLGFGPVAPPSKENNIHTIHLAHPPAIAHTESNCLRLNFSSSCTKQDIQAVEQAMQLAAWFGTLGGRSRNGWGSLIIEGEGIAPFPDDDGPLQPFALHLKQTLGSDWGNALGLDRGGVLLWQDTVKTWEAAVNRLASLRKETRKAVKGIEGQGMKASYLLGFPLTKAKAYAWKNEARLPNQLRFKVLPYGDELLLCIAHFPCAVPDMLWKDRQQRAQDWVTDNQLTIWQKVHAVLDEDPKMMRLGGGQ